MIHTKSLSIRRYIKKAKHYHEKKTKTDHKSMQEVATERIETESLKKKKKTTIYGKKTYNKKMKSKLISYI